MLPYVERIGIGANRFIMFSSLLENEILFP